MQRRIIVVLIVAIPILLFANVYQAYRYTQLEREIGRLESEQLALIEENKRAILAVTVLTSPQRVGPLAVDELALRRLTGDDIIRLSGESGAAQ